MLEIRSLQLLHLKPLSLSVADGECVVLRGASGSGKSLILRSVADLEVHHGDVFLDGKSAKEMSGPAWRRQVRFVAAEPGWWGETPIMHFADADFAKAQATQLGLDPALLTRSIQHLSTGERQRFAFARALEDKPKVLLLDEPTGALDQVATGLVEEVIGNCLKEGVSVLMVSHDPDQAARLADRQYLLEDGALKEVGE